MFLLTRHCLKLPRVITGTLMIKKFISNALLSVVMDKTARKRLDTIRTGKNPEEETLNQKPKNKESASKKINKKSKTSSKPEVASDNDILKTISEALEEARKEAAEGTLQRSTRASSLRAPAALKSPVARKSSPPPSDNPLSQRNMQPTQPLAPQRHAGQPAREKLIEEAMSIHRQKSHILDDLDPMARDKLMLMAQYALDPDSLSPEIRARIGQAANAEGLVDNKGSVGKRRPKRKLTRK